MNVGKSSIQSRFAGFLAKNIGEKGLNRIAKVLPNIAQEARSIQIDRQLEQEAGKTINLESGPQTSETSKTPTQKIQDEIKSLESSIKENENQVKQGYTAFKGVINGQKENLETLKKELQEAQRQETKANQVLGRNQTEESPKTTGESTGVKKEQEGTSESSSNIQKDFKAALKENYTYLGSKFMRRTVNDAKQLNGILKRFADNPAQLSQNDLDTLSRLKSSNNKIVAQFATQAESQLSDAIQSRLKTDNPVLNNLSEVSGESDVKETAKDLKSLIESNYSEETKSLTPAGREVVKMLARSENKELMAALLYGEKGESDSLSAAALGDEVSSLILNEFLPGGENHQESLENITDILIHLMKTELDQTPREANNPLRGATFFPKMSTQFMKAVGSTWLQENVGALIKDAGTFDLADYEVDSTRPPINSRPKEGQMEKNNENLANFAEKTVTTFLDGLETLPPALKNYIGKYSAVVDKMRPGETEELTGGLVALRFFSPALTTPQHWGITEKAPEGSQRRILTLATKVFQNISNQKTFGGREQFMEPQNQVVEKYMGQLGGAVTSPTTFPRPETI